MTLEAWYRDESETEQKKPHRLNPNQPVSVDQLRRLGVSYWKLDPDVYETDPELERIRRNRGFSYMDIITLHPDTQPGCEDKLRMFYQEHLHLDDEVRYILEGQAYFDIRDKEDRWIRVAASRGDLLTMPAGMYHRFTLDETNYTKAMRLFAGDPVWKAYYRPADDLQVRKEYLAFLQES